MRIWSIVGALVVVAFVVAILALLHPPRTLRMAAGPENGAYYQIALEYRRILARDGLDMEIVETAGSAENIRLLEERGVEVAIIQGGITTKDPGIEAIASIFFEPMIVLARTDSDIPDNPVEWVGLRIASGSEGSGTAVAFQEFQTVIGLPIEANQHFRFTYDEAITALTDGDIDMAVFVAPIEAPYLQKAYRNPEIMVVRLSNVQAISRLLSHANVVTVPAGAVSLRPVIPDGPRKLLALDARLAIGPDIHPALVNRLTLAAVELHSGRGMIRDQGTFPTIHGTELPVNNAARQLILEGPSTVHDWLPYWLAAQVNRVLILLLPIFFLIVPLLRALPGLYAYLMGWRVWQHYPAIREIEDELENSADISELAQMDARLEDLDDRLSRLRLPSAYRNGAYDARMHIDLVRKRIGARHDELTES